MNKTQIVQLVQTKLRKLEKTKIYNKKSENESKVISELGRQYTNTAPAIVGIVEVENRKVLEDLVKQPALAKYDYGIVHFNSILDAIKNDFLTNVSSDALYGFVNKQLSEGMQWNIVSYHILGETGLEVCASAPGQELSVVYPYPNQVEFVKNVMDQIDAGDIVEQEDLPDGKYKTSSK